MNDIVVSLMLLGALGSDGQMPFWANTNRFGTMPDSSGGVAIAGVAIPYQDLGKFQYRAGVSMAARSDSYSTFELFPDEAYAGLKLWNLALDMGIMHKEQDFMASDHRLGSLSASGGSVINSGNARSMPGYTASLTPLNLGKYLTIRGDFGDYLTYDNRSVKNALVHELEGYADLHITDRLTFTLGLDHYAMWGGEGNNVTLGNYLRVITGRAAGDDGTKSDQLNVIGDQLGAELFKLSYRGNGWSAVAQHSIPYEDKSGMEFFNFPDGINTLSFSFDDRSRWISDVVYEYHYTLWQSGNRHDPEFGTKEELDKWMQQTGFTYPPNYRGGDNYFGNSAYPSGWTHFGRTIGTPFIFPVGTKAGTVNRNEPVECPENSRYTAHHLGLSGMLFRQAPYRLMLTYSRNHGNYRTPYKGESIWQKPLGTVKDEYLSEFFSGLEVLWPVKGFDVMTSVYLDAGDFYGTRYGASLGICVKL